MKKNLTALDFTAVDIDAAADSQSMAKSKPGSFSRNKGARGEREFANELGQLINIPWLHRNLSQYQNSGHDITEDPLPGIVPTNQQLDTINRLKLFSIEIKRYARAKPSLIQNWFEQACDQASHCQPQRIPLLAYRQDYFPWIILIPGAQPFQLDLCLSLPLPLFSLWLLHSPHLLTLANETDAHDDSCLMSTG